MKRVALFVGVDRYEDGAFRDLRYSVTDAASLAVVFGRYGYETHVATNPGNQALLDEVQRRTAGLGPGDVFVFFFAGHGYTGPGGEHLLICRDDRLQWLLRHNRAGVPVDLLEDLTNGKGVHRAFLLDACRTDVFSGVAGRGAAGTRDLGLVAMPDAGKYPGTCCVVRSCDRFCPALEFEDLGHGVFTQAVLDFLSEPEGRAVRMGEAFADGVRERMRIILRREGSVAEQTPTCQSNGAAFALFEEADVLGAAAVTAGEASAFGACAKCGRWRPATEMFVCRTCGKAYCMEHQDAGTFQCGECAEKERETEGERLFREGESLWEGRRFEEAVEAFREAAELGHPGAQFQMGWMCEEGEWAEKDNGVAAEWYRAAAEQGNRDAQCNLGVLYETGCGVEADDGEAVRWYREAARHGHAEAQYNLGRMHEAGRGGVVRSEEEAAKWYRRAAEQGFAAAQCNLGVLLSAKKRHAEAVKWFRAATKQGDADAECNLGEMYENGRGVGQDAAKAAECYRAAAKAGNTAGMRNLGRMYEEGRTGVRKNVRAATEWYRNAAELGDAEAVRKLEAWKESGNKPEGDSGEAKGSGVVRRAGTQGIIRLPGGEKMEMVWCPPGEFTMGSPESEPGHRKDEVLHRVTLTRGFWLAKHPVTQKQWKSVMGGNPSRFGGLFARGKLPVEEKKPNAWGLHDMHGNVWEWCEDICGDGAGSVLRGGSWCTFAKNCRSAYRGHDTQETRNPGYGFRPVLEDQP